MKISEKLLGFYILSCVLLSALYIPSAGGSGVNLAYNLLLTLCVGGFVIFTAFVKYYPRREYNNQCLIILGVAGIGIPWLLQINNNAGCIVLLISFLLWWYSQKWYIHQKTKQKVVFIFFCIALVQAIIAIIQTFYPSLALSLYEYNWLRNHGRPYGIFQQVNLLASFLATGTGCGFLLLLKEKRKPAVILYIVGLSGLSFVLSINQSRAGILGAFVVLSALTLLFGKQVKLRTGAALLSMIAAMAAGSWIVQHTHVIMDGQFFSLARSFEDSTRSRARILRITMKMITLKPWFGWGYGSFEYMFSRFAIAHADYQYRRVVTHPHNELLFSWFQGGVVALTGILLLCCGWVKNIISAWKEPEHAAGYALLILPLLVHLNLEYPFYQSFIHLATFVVLLRVGEIDKWKETALQGYPKRAMMTIMGAGLIGYSLLALCAHYHLTRYEREGYVSFPVPMPWYFAMQSDRSRYDAMVALLVDYNRTQNAEDLSKFMVQASRYSLRHNDKNIWLSMIAIARHQGNELQAYQLQQQYQKLFADTND